VSRGIQGWNHRPSPEFDLGNPGNCPNLPAVWHNRDQFHLARRTQNI